MICIDSWAHIHPLLKVLSVDWDDCVAFGFLHAPKPSPNVQRFLDTVRQVKPVSEREAKG